MLFDLSVMCTWGHGKNGNEEVGTMAGLVYPYRNKPLSKAAQKVVRTG